MCGFDEIYGMLIAAQVLLMASTVACATALALNASIVGSLGAYIAFAITLATATAAALLLTGAASQVGFCNPPPCILESKTASTWIGLAAGALWTALAVAAIMNWLAAVPIAGTPMIVAFGFALAAAITAMSQMNAALKVLAKCLTAPPPATAQTVEAFSAILVFLGIVSLLALGIIEAHSAKEGKGGGID